MIAEALEGVILALSWWNPFYGICIEWFLPSWAKATQHTALMHHVIGEANLCTRLYLHFLVCDCHSLSQLALCNSWSLWWGDVQNHRLRKQDCICLAGTICSPWCSIKQSTGDISLVLTRHERICPWCRHFFVHTSWRLPLQISLYSLDVWVLSYHKKIPHKVKISSSSTTAPAKGEPSHSAHLSLAYLKRAQTPVRCSPWAGLLTSSLWATSHCSPSTDHFFHV